MLIIFRRNCSFLNVGAIYKSIDIQTNGKSNDEDEHVSPIIIVNGYFNLRINNIFEDYNNYDKTIFLYVLYSMVTSCKLYNNHV